MGVSMRAMVARHRLTPNETRPDCLLDAADRKRAHTAHCGARTRQDTSRGHPVRPSRENPRRSHPKSAALA
ncbi:hypothetical protein B0G75_107238 [Paraburkholderia sp. BL18I3N2]|nr:hypothetical protein B0G75_107238 [Paraburkholderia sp. BL18I3N2]